ncbi:unnamed protein product [Closterium sp. Naga37s-1]|nr:unnamed protein product [Closterium sp. Naga37s-1]
MLVRHLSNRFKDLDSLVGVRLFMPDEWEDGRAERHRQCLGWLGSLVTLFRAEDMDYIIPGQVVAYIRAVHEIWCSYKKRRPFGSVAAPPAREGEGSGGRGKEAVEEELEAWRAKGSDADDDNNNKHASSDDD